MIVSRGYALSYIGQGGGRNKETRFNLRSLFNDRAAQVLCVVFIEPCVYNVQDGFYQIAIKWPFSPLDLGLLTACTRGFLWSLHP